jgi:hypothetical protein
MPDALVYSTGVVRWAILVVVIGAAAVACGSSEQSGGGSTSGGSTSGGSTSGGSTSGGSTSGGSTSGGSTSGGGGGEDVPVCTEALPRDGASCSPNGRTCQTAGSPCGNIHTCRNGVWESQTVCPPVQECPTDMPEQGQMCTAQNPVIGLMCYFSSGCGDVGANCEDSRWQLTPNPVTECQALCNDVCLRLGECGITWLRDCPALCGLQYLCPGESPGQDSAICTGESERLAALDCTDLCAAVTTDDPATAFGVDCDLMPQ